MEEQFKKFGSQIACIILEPVIGSGGFIPATREYLQTARRLADQYGVVLIFDEVISGFRFRAGDVGHLYGVKPDLVTLGKIIGGGMPVAAVAGSQKILELTSGQSGPKVWFSGGTYSGHPASMLAAKTILHYLIDNEKTVYPRIAALGQKTRQMVIESFHAEGIEAISTGYNHDLPDSSLFCIYFPQKSGIQINSPEDAASSKLNDLVLSKKVLFSGLLLEDVYLLEG